MSDLIFHTGAARIIEVNLPTVLVIKLYVVNATIIIISCFDSSDRPVSGVDQDFLLTLIVIVSSSELRRRLSISHVELYE